MIMVAHCFVYYTGVIANFKYSELNLKLVVNFILFKRRANEFGTIKILIQPQTF